MSWQDRQSDHWFAFLLLDIPDHFGPFSFFTSLTDLFHLFNTNIYFFEQSFKQLPLSKISYLHLFTIHY